MYYLYENNFDAVSYLYNYFLKDEDKELYFYDGSQAYVRDENKVLIAGKEDDEGNIIEYYSYKTIEGKEFIKKQLNSGKPVVIGGNNGNYDHYALVVGYKGTETEEDEFILLDPLGSEKYLSEFEDDFGEKTWYFNQNYPILYFPN